MDIQRSGKKVDVQKWRAKRVDVQDLTAGVEWGRSKPRDFETKGAYGPIG